MRNIFVVVAIFIFSKDSISQKTLDKNYDTIFFVTEGLSNNIVKSCDKNSMVVKLTLKMRIPDNKLQKSYKVGEYMIYKLYNKNRPLYFKYSYKLNLLKVKLNNWDYHCFEIDSTFKFFFARYKIGQKDIEIYGEISDKKVKKNFRLIFYLKTSEVKFDFDDEIFLSPPPVSPTSGTKQQQRVSIK